MSYLDSLNRFSVNPTTLDIRRSTFKRNSSHKTTFVAGKLVPIYLDEIVPGDTVSMDVASVIRSITPAVPVMDDAFLDVYFFWCPARICTAHAGDWEKIHGENKNGFWAPAIESTLENTGNNVGVTSDVSYDSLGAYLGIPIGNYSDYDDDREVSLRVSALPFNAYGKIWSEWFRDENTQSPVGNGSLFPESDLLYVNKIHDYFTSCLPSPQKGQSVLLPIAGYAPVITRSTAVTHSKDYPSLNWKTVGSSSTTFDGMLKSDGSTGTLAFTTDSLPPADEDIVTSDHVYPSNLWADLSLANAVSVNQMREAFAIQKLLEKDARGGTRYREMLKAHFGVSIPDNTVQVPEYLGGKRVPLNMLQVLQSSETSTTPLGTTGAFSNTYLREKMFVKSFTEYGYLMGVCCVRTSQSYSQGIPKLFTRNRRYDWYYPVMANLGEQAVYKKELYLPADYTESNLNSVFGYQEAWADYRYKPNLITGLLAPNAGDSVLSSWTYSNNFNTQPTLNSDFMKQPRAQIDKTLVVTNANYQFIADFYFDATYTRPMPIYSIPGLIDHH